MLVPKDMLKTSSADELLHAVRKVAAGELAIEQEVSKKVEYHRNHIELHEELTARERDVLQLIAKGYENQRIADELFISQDGQDPCVQYPCQT